MERAELAERRMEPVLLVFAVLTIPAIVLDQSGLEAPWPTLAVCRTIRSTSQSWCSPRRSYLRRCRPRESSGSCAWCAY